MPINKEKIFISSIIYVYNNQQSIYQFLTFLNRELNEYFEHFEIICVNDASKDDSVKEIQDFSKKNPDCQISILNMGFYQGLELSMVAGMDLSIGDFIFEFDTIHIDYRPEIIFSIYNHCLKGYDIVSASPQTKRNGFSQLFYMIFNKYSETEYLLKPETFRIMSRRAANRIHGISVTIPYRKAVYANCGLKIDTIVYDCSNIQKKSNQAEFNKNIDTALDAIILHTNFAYKCSVTLSFLMMMIAFLLGLYAVFIYIGGNPVAGWTTTILFLACVFGGLFMVLTIIIKYISLILKIVFNKQKYIIESIDKLSN